MPNICSKCGEYTKVRKRRYYLLLSLMPSLSEYICKKCEDAEKIINKKYEEDKELEERRKRKTMIKMRDKLLEETWNKKNGRNI